jgi:hypothetical protein
VSVEPKNTDQEPRDSEPKSSEHPESLDNPSENQETPTTVEGTNVKPPTETSPKIHTTSPSKIISNILSEIHEEHLNLGQTESSERPSKEDEEPNVTTSGPAIEEERIEKPDKECQEQEDDDVPLSQILKNKGSAQQEIMKVGEDTKSGEGVCFSIPISTSKARTYKSKQVVTPKTGKKGKRNAEKKASGENSSKRRQLITASESEEDVEADVPYIMTSRKKRIGGRRVPANVPPAPMDNISFHSEESVQKWRYVYQRRIA